MFLFLLFLSIPSIQADKLVQVHVVWRHGDRTPMMAYPTDPYLPYWSQWPSATLTTLGMSQHFQQGLRLKQRYIDELKFISKNYNFSEILVQSWPAARCVQSASSNMAGFYSGSENTHPGDQGWPSQWTPVPVYTRDNLPAHNLYRAEECARNDILSEIRKQNPEYVKFEAEHMPLIRKIEKYSGVKFGEMDDFLKLYDCLRIEKLYRKWSLPSWLTEEDWIEFTGLRNSSEDYLWGEAGHGIGEDHEMFKLDGGPLMTTIVKSMQAAQNSSADYKMYTYSAHDTTTNALLRVLGAKLKLLGYENPQYASMTAFELWHGSSGYYVKMLYSANEKSSFIPVTHLVRGCDGRDNCPYSIFYGTSRPYFVENIVELCNNVAISSEL